MDGDATLIGGSGGLALKGSDGADVRARGGRRYAGRLHRQCILLEGGAGKDLFIFNRAGSVVHDDTVTNFAQGTDKLMIGSGVSVNALLAGTGHSGNHVTYAGGNAVIHLGTGSTITLVGVTGPLTASDFGSSV